MKQSMYMLSIIGYTIVDMKGKVKGQYGIWYRPWYPLGEKIVRKE